MARHFERIWVSPEDKRILKTTASLHGKTISEAFSEMVRRDAEKTKMQFEAVSEQYKEEQQKDLVRRNRFGWFKQ